MIDEQPTMILKASFQIGKKETKDKPKEEPKKQEVSINQAMEDAVIIGAEENPYYEGLQISELEVRKM